MEEFYLRLSDKPFAEKTSPYLVMDRRHGLSEITIRDFAEEIVKLTGTNQKIVYHPLPQDDPKQRQPDTTKARTLLGWEAKVPRSVGLKITYEYFKSLPKEVLYDRDHKNFENYIR